MPPASKTTRLLLAASAAWTAASAAATSADAQTYSGAFANTSLGKVAAATSGTTVFKFDPSGAVSVDSGSGGVFLRQTSTNARFALSFGCTPGRGSSHACPTQITIYVTTPTSGGTTGAFGNITNLTYSVVTGTFVTSGVYGNGIYVTVTPNSSSHAAALYFGGKVPVSANPAGGLTGSASANATAQVVDSSLRTILGPFTATLSGTVVRPLSITENSALNFGTIVRPLSGSGTVTILATNGSFSAVSPVVALSSPAPVRGSFTINGEGGQVISVTIPSSFTMNNGSGGTIAVTTSNTGSGSQILSNSLGSAGSFNFYVGGQFTVSNTTPTGTYTGVYNIGAQYN